MSESTIDNTASVYAKFFGEENPNWSKILEHNVVFIVAQESYANAVLQSRGHLFLNEVYDMLGFKRSTDGQLVGWLAGELVKFDRRFNQYDPESRILIDFNVPGMMYNKI